MRFINLMRNFHQRLQALFSFFAILCMLHAAQHCANFLLLFSPPHYPYIAHTTYISRLHAKKKKAQTKQIKSLDFELSA